MQRISPKSVLSAALVLAGLAAQPAFANTYCSDASYSGTLAATDMTFNNAAASDCYGATSGNDNAAAINGLTAWQDPIGNWALLAKTEPGANTNTLSGIHFTLSASGATAGTWTLSATDTNGPDYANLPVFMDFVGVLKAGNGFAAYFFDDVEVGAVNSGTWTIAFTNRGGQTPDLSHLSLYTRVGLDGAIPPIPEAETYAMMLAGLGLVGLMARRRRSHA
ncbi:MAG: PEP-CTERM sorting domain-containing protein [Pseudomonadota bacterium]